MDCSHCRKPITGQYYPEDGGRSCCLACHEARLPVCAACGRKCTGAAAMVEGRHYHPECFACADCRQQIRGSYLKFEGGFRCEACHKRANPPKVCAACRREIVGAYKMTQHEGREYPFHVECFTCSQCRKPLGERFAPASPRQGRRSDVPQYRCEDCLPKCPVCSKLLDGQVVQPEPGKQMHAECFRCYKCRKQIWQGPFKSMRGGYACIECYGKHAQVEADRKELRRQKTERSERLEQKLLHGLAWKPELAPTAGGAMRKLGLAKDWREVAVTFDGRNVGVAKASGRPVNLDYLAVALRTFTDTKREPVFSLDPKDPHDLSGQLQKKVFYPSNLSGTAFGEVLFQADYLLKEMCFGEASTRVALPGVFDAPRKEGEEVASRQWFVIQHARVTQTRDGVLVPDVRLAVQARRMVKGKHGYEDAPATHDHDSEPSAVFARAVSDHIVALKAEFPVIEELFYLAEAVCLARYLLEHGVQPDLPMLKRFGEPVLRNYNMEIPTLVKTMNQTAINVTGGGLQSQTLKRAIHGGVDLSVPKIKEAKSPEIALKPEPGGAPPAVLALPLFQTARAA